MLRQKISRGWLVSSVASILLGIAAPLLVMMPASALSCTWADKTTLNCGNEAFKNPQVSGSSITLTGNTTGGANDGGNKTCPSDTLKTTTGGKSGTETTYTVAVQGKFGNVNCTQHTTNVTLTNTYSSVGGKAGNGNGNGNGNSNSNGAGNANGTSCGGGSFDWVICPTDALFQTLAQALLNFMQSLLYINTSNGSGIFGQNTNGKAYYQAWNTFRILGTALIVIAGLVMVSAQAFGFEFLDAYTIRKVLPRLFVAIVGMSLSWPLLNFIINFFNIVGQDIQQLMYAPFSQLPNHAQTADGIISWGFLAIIAGLLAAGFGAVLLPILGTGALALLVAVLVLIVRQIGVTLLVIMAPFAIAAYVLPNTKKIWDIWKDNFLGLMLMYPIIMMLIAAGEIFGAVGKSGSFAQQIVGIVAFFVPYFMIPLAFRMATGFISQISGMMNDRSKGAFDRLRNARGNIMKNRGEALRGYNRFKGGNENNFRGRMNKALGRVGNINQAGFNPTRMAGNMKAYESRHHNAEAAEFREKNAAFGMISGNEDYVYAALESGGNEAKLKKILMNKYGYDEHTTNQAMAQIRNARQGVSDEVFERASVLALAASGTGLKERDVNRVDANGDLVRDANGNVVTDHVRGGAGELNSYINSVWGDDRIGAASGAVAARGLAGQARRFDINGNSTGTALGLLEQQYAYDTSGGASGKSANQVTTETIKGALEGQGGNYVVGARKAAVEAFAPEMTENLSKQFTAGVGGGVDEVGLSRELAKLAGRYDAMAQVAPENAEVMADKVLGQTLTSAAADPRFQRKRQVQVKVTGPDGKERMETRLENTGEAMTVREMIEAYRDDEHFLNMRKEFGISGRQGAVQAQQQSAQQQAAAAVQAGPVPPPQPPPGG